MPRLRTALLTAVAAAFLAHLLTAGPALAHGGSVGIAVACTAPDPARPLARICTAVLRYPDGDPVSDARLQLTAARRGTDPLTLGPVVFSPLADAGAYAATVSFPAYGTWQMRLEVRRPGRGETELVEDLLPPAPGASGEIAARLQLTLDLGLLDLRNLAIRIVHLLASAAWFGVVSLVLAMTVLLGPGERARLLGRAARMFPWATGGSLLLVGLSGAANALYNTPARPPGLLDPQALAGLPFGRVYLSLFVVKMGLVLTILVATTALGVALRVAYGASAGVASAGKEGRVRRLALVNVVLGSAMFAGVVVLGYVHMVAHVGGAAGAR